MTGKASIEFSILTSNLRFGLADDGPNRWSSRKKAFPAFLQHHAADFICFQEANDFQIDYLQSLLPDYRYIGRRAPAPAFWQNNVIFYRHDWNCVVNRHFYLSHTPETPSRYRLSRWPRQCTLGLFERGGLRLLCANTHFDFDSQVQDASARLILQKVNNLAVNIPAILAGDFNATPQSSCHRILTGSSTAVYTNPSEHFSNVLHPPYPGTFHGWSGQKQGDCLDWILYRGNLVPNNVIVIRDKYSGYYPSDHFPIRANFTES